MIFTSYFRKLMNNATGLTAMQARFDILQSKLDTQTRALKSLESSAERMSATGLDAMQAGFDILQAKLVAIATSLEGVTASLNNIEKVAKSQYSELDTKKKFAFLVHDPIMLVHYADVWKALGSPAFTIVTTEFFSFDQNGNEKLGLSDFLNHVHAEGYEVRKIIEIINCGIKFEYVVTNHVISGSTKEVKPETAEDRDKKIFNRGLIQKGQEPVWEFSVDVNTYLPLQIGNKQIRYMYGADISEGWSLQSWNDIYDIFLCHGVNDEREIKKRFKGEALVMGYPRYDRFFSGEIDFSNIKREFGISESKKTVLWMPSLGGDYSSIPLFAKPLSTLSEKYNLIVRPHPLSFIQEKDFIGLLEEFDFHIDRTALRDMNELFGVADVVLADHGGTPFSAIFLGRNVIFLDVPDDLGVESAATSYIAGSSVLELKKYLPIVTSQDIHMLESMLDSEEFYEENSQRIDALFEKYFNSPRGGGAKRVADIFNGL